jgi:hypothetical protein
LETNVVIVSEWVDAYGFAVGESRRAGEQEIGKL